MKTTRILLLASLWMGMTFTTFAQSGARGPMSASSIGHMAVTLLSPAALTSTQNLEFNNIPLRSTEASSVVADNNLSMATIRVSGMHVTCSVTVTNKKIDYRKYGKSLSISYLTSVSTQEETGVSKICISATMNISPKETAAIAEAGSPMAVIINYN